MRDDVLRYHEDASSALWHCNLFYIVVDFSPSTPNLQEQLKKPITNLRSKPRLQSLEFRFIWETFGMSGVIAIKDDVLGIRWDPVPYEQSDSSGLHRSNSIKATAAEFMNKLDIMTAITISERKRDARKAHIAAFETTRKAEMERMLEDVRSGRPICDVVREDRLKGPQHSELDIIMSMELLCEQHEGLGSRRWLDNNGWSSLF
jgi:hypothetical protein